MATGTDLQGLMGKTASSSRRADLSPLGGEVGKVRPDDTPSTGKRLTPVGEDQPTIISGRVPILAPELTDAAGRILQGKILPGDHLEHFELLEFVGGGGMGRVFRGFDTRLARTVALKILAPDQTADDETLARFHNEAQSAARLDHGNISRVHYVGKDQGLHFIVFEFVEGVNVRRLVEQKGSLSLAESISYTLQVAEALAHASGRDVVHRDVKPSNMLITPQGQVKLIDMGLARLTRLDTSANDLTASGVTLGTFDYISPEQARDPRNADVRSDIYSLGCTFFFMLAGRPPFPEGTVLQKLLQHQGDQPPDIRQFRPDVPEDAARVLRKMLAKDPRRRYNDSDELMADLMAVAERIGLQPVSPGSRVYAMPGEVTVSFLHRHLPWIAPVTALIAIVLLLEFFPRRELSAPPAAIPPATVREGHSGTSAEGPPRQSEPADQGLQGSPDEGARQSPGAESSPTEGTAGDETPSVIPSAEAVDPVGLEPVDELSAGGFGSHGLSFDPLGAGLSAVEDTSWLPGGAAGAESLSAGLTAAVGASEQPEGVGAPADLAPKRNGFLVVGDPGEGENVFPTLAAACSVAANGDIIELHYHGRRKEPERPIKLANMRLTIRSGKDYRPVVTFRPGGADPVKYPRSMFTVSSGRLTLSDLALELEVPREVPAENWSLFETRGAQSVWLENCSLTIRNASDQYAAYHPEVTFFRARSAPGADADTPENGSAARPPMVLDLVDCIVRGEATLLRIEDLQPAHLVWENGLLITTERLLSAYGEARSPHPGEMLQLDLRYLTAVVRGGLCLLTDSQARPHLLPAQVYCADCILVGSSDAPLIEQAGADEFEDYQQRVAWAGDRNFYEDIEVFSRVCDLNGEALAEPKGFEAWQTSEDETQSGVNQVVWQLPPRGDVPLCAQTPADYTSVDSFEANPAYGAGFQANQLPELPELPAKAEEPDAGE